jgi:phosphatidylinositol 4-kinase
LGFEKSYRESIVLMTRSYLDKAKAVGAAENNTLPSEATIERTEVCDESNEFMLSYKVVI